ncbi:alpha/beta fold hydrolase [Burkholderia sp. Ac-20379]|uniref:alpha/beta fold hydrolase n=1 Tax=Burkholderia sp. Ac-20379 TaxID=2703900 RepID=UPI00197E1579|nr:alpha/beta hydrolase [Burkholderia sp. Ac-20379]MBN3723235.1 alpha/beta hydrolase [Burkholderia sp. Ac-20379]
MPDATPVSPTAPIAPIRLADPLAAHVVAHSPPPPAWLDDAIDAILDVLLEVQRRNPAAFRQQPLRLSSARDARWPVSATGIDWPALVRCVARLCEIDVVESAQGVTADGVATLLADACRDVSLRHGIAAAQDAPSSESPRIAARLPDESGFNQAEPVRMRVAARLADEASRAAPRYLDLPDLDRVTTASGQPYLRYRRGATPVLLLNAFGMPHDVWSRFAAALPDDHAVYLFDDADSGGGDAGFTRVYYATPDAPARFAHAVRELMANESLDSLHLVSWCGGVRYALELARTLPGRIASMSFLAPSFAGAAAGVGQDSAYETNLHTMAKLVNRMPQAANSMAESMRALLDKQAAPGAASDDAALFSQPDANTRHWLGAPFASASNMVEYSRQLAAFREHAVETSIGPALGPVPCLLITGEYDEMTSAARAHDLCDGFANVQRFVLRFGAHQMIHQNAALLAAFVSAFIATGDTPSPLPSRVVRSETEKTRPDDVETGEL